MPPKSFLTQASPRKMSTAKCPVLPNIAPAADEQFPAMTRHSNPNWPCRQNWKHGTSACMWSLQAVQAWEDPVVHAANKASRADIGATPRANSKRRPFQRRTCRSLGGEPAKKDAAGRQVTAPTILGVPVTQPQSPESAIHNRPRRKPHFHMALRSVFAREAPDLLRHPYGMR